MEKALPSSPERGRTASDVVLRASGLCKAFEATQALDGAALEVRRGEVHALVGGNGSGKSTLLKILAGVHTADAGSAEVRGVPVDLSNFDAYAASALGLHFVHQQPTVFGELTVAENLALGRARGFETAGLGRISWRATRRHAAEVLERFEIPVGPDEPVRNLSPATQTTIAIARALQDPGDGEGSVLALDEPTAALPPSEVARLFETLRRHARAGHAVLFVSHRLDEVLAVADRITVLRDGATVATVPAGELDKEGLAELIVGRPVDDYYRPAAPPKVEGTLLEVEHLSGGSVRDASLQVCAGEIVGIAGLAGSGRSSLLRLLYGAQTAAGGGVRLEGAPYAPREPVDAVDRGVVYLSENRLRDSILPGLSVSENLAVVALERHWNGAWINRRSERTESSTAMARFEIRASSTGAPMTSLSGGNQQKVALGRWLQHKPRLLLLDEPTQGVDVGARAELWNLVREAAEGGAAVVMVSSDFEELTHLCGRLIVLRNGCTVAEVATEGMSPDEVNRMLHELQTAA